MSCNNSPYYSSSRREDSRRADSSRHIEHQQGRQLPSLRTQLPEFFRENRLATTNNSRRGYDDVRPILHRYRLQNLIVADPDQQYSSHPGHQASHGSTPSPPRQDSSAYHSSSQSRSHYNRNELDSHGPFSVFDQDMVQQRNSELPHAPSRPPKASAIDPARRHICSVCPGAFDRKSSLETHMRTHTQEKPFTCDVPKCGKSFAVLSNLRRHKKTHDATRMLVPVDDSYEDHYHSRGGSSGIPYSSSSYYFSSRAK